jgi:hypothetical protein
MKRFLKVICAVLAIGLVACEEPEPIVTPNTAIASLGSPGDNEIWFTTADDKELMALNQEAFDAQIVEIEYSELGINVIHFDRSITTIGARAFDNCRNIKNISLPENITTIGDRAFYECINLECITLGSKIKSCGMQAFDNCISLYTLHIQSIGDWCQIEFADPTANPLYHCGMFVVNGNRVTDITIPDWVSHIGDYALYGYTMLSSVTISKNIDSIGKEAFYGCENLTKVDVKDIAAWCNTDFTTAFSNPLAIASSLYINGEPATTISLKGVESIKSKVFQGCNNIRSFEADDSLKTIGEEAFRGCMELKQVNLGNGITEIGGKAFMGCFALNSVTVMRADPPTLADKYVFDYNAEDRKIYVPSASLDTYKSHVDWNRYADSIEALN